MDGKEVDLFSRREAVEWLRDIGLAVNGTKEELQCRIKKYIRYPKLVNKLKTKCRSQFKFSCSLDPLCIPPITAKWKTNYESLPIITLEAFKVYASHKKEGSLGQQEKAYRMIHSLKIVSIKILQNEDNTFIKAIIKKSYGQQSRPAVVLFEGGNIKSAHCNCPIGASGLCCHVLALLLFLNHYHLTNEKLLELTCTQQLQKWHRRTKKGSIPMIPIKDINVESAKIKKKHIQKKKSFVRRNVSEMISELNKKLDKEVCVNEHFHSVLSKSEIGKKSSVGQLLSYKNTINLIGDHDYCSQEIAKCSYDSNCSSEKKLDLHCNNDAVYVNNIEKRLEKEINEQFLNSEFVILNLEGLEASKASGMNYVNISQNTPLWMEERKNKITASRLSSLVGLNSKNKFEFYWDVVIHGIREKDLSSLENIRRGHIFESEAINYFEKMSNSKTERCGFFKHPDDQRYGASPDALGPPGILLEIKTRAKCSDGPLTSLASHPNYFLQCQMQMTCTERNYCILLSYHPETKSGNFFLIKRDNVLIDVLMDLCNHILESKKLITWNHNEIRELKLIGDALIGHMIDFEQLKAIRTYIRKCAKSSIANVKFFGNSIDFMID